MSSFYARSSHLQLLIRDGLQPKEKRIWSEYRTIQAAILSRITISTVNRERMPVMVNEEGTSVAIGRVSFWHPVLHDTLHLTFLGPTCGSRLMDMWYGKMWMLGPRLQDMSISHKDIITLSISFFLNYFYFTYCIFNNLFDGMSFISVLSVGSRLSHSRYLHIMDGIPRDDRREV